MFIFDLWNCYLLLPCSLLFVFKCGMLIYFYCLKVTFKMCIKVNKSHFFHYYIYRDLIVLCNLFFLLAKSSVHCFWWIRHPYEHHKSGHCLSLLLWILWMIFSSFSRPTLTLENICCIIWSIVSILCICILSWCLKLQELHTEFLFLFALSKVDVCFGHYNVKPLLSLQYLTKFVCLWYL